MKLTRILLTLALNFVLGSFIGSCAASGLGIDPSVFAIIGGTVNTAVSLIPGKVSNMFLTITYNPIEFKGPHFQEIFTEVLFMNNTISNGIVRFLPDIKTETALTEAAASVTIQAYKSRPVSGDAAGTLTIKDYITRPVQLMLYDEFTPNDFKYTRFGQDAPKGAFNNISDDLNRLILELYGKQQSLKAESLFWHGAKTSTKSTVAGLTPGAGQTSVSAAHQAYVASAPTSLFDGIVTRLIYDRGAVGKRIKVAGTTITTSNIAAEYAKVFAVIPAVLLQQQNRSNLYYYVPYSHMAMIDICNTNATYRDLFRVANGKYYYNNIEIQFVPMPEDTIIASTWSNLCWGTDTLDDLSFIKLDLIQANSEDLFLKSVFTQETAIVNAPQIVLYQ